MNAIRYRATAAPTSDMALIVLKFGNSITPAIAATKHSIPSQLIVLAVNLIRSLRTGTFCFARMSFNLDDTTPHHDVGPRR